MNSLNVISELENIEEQRKQLLKKAGNLVAQELKNEYDKGVSSPVSVQKNIQKMLKDYNDIEKFEILKIATSLFIVNM